MFADCDLCLDFFGNSTGLGEFTVTESDLECSGFGDEEMRNETSYPPDINEAGRCARINHCVSVNPAFTRPEVDFDYNMQIWMIRERFVTMRRR